MHPCQLDYPCPYLKHISGDQKGMCTAGPFCIITKLAQGLVQDTRTGEILTYTLTQRTEQE